MSSTDRQRWARERPELAWNARGATQWNPCLSRTGRRLTCSRPPATFGATREGATCSRGDLEPYLGRGPVAEAKCSIPTIERLTEDGEKFYDVSNDEPKYIQSGRGSLLGNCSPQCYWDSLSRVRSPIRSSVLMAGCIFRCKGGPLLLPGPDQQADLPGPREDSSDQERARAPPSHDRF